MSEPATKPSTLPKPNRPRRSTPLALKLFTIPSVVGLLLLGLYVFAGQLAPGYYTTIGFGIAWFVVASFALGKLTKRVPDLRWWVRGTFLATSAVVTAVAVYTSFVGNTVNERIATGVTASQLRSQSQGGSGAGAAAGSSSAGRTRGGKAASKPAKPSNVLLAAGTVTGIGHSGSGRASVIRLAKGGRVVTLSKFSIQPTQNTDVYLVPRQVNSDADVKKFVKIGDLKGTSGNQQYQIPKGLSTKNATLVFWCVPFTTRVAQAPLSPA